MSTASSLAEKFPLPGFALALEQQLATLRRTRDFMIDAGVSHQRNPQMDPALGSIAAARTTCHATLSLLDSFERTLEVEAKIHAVTGLLDQIGEIMSILDWLGARHEPVAMT